MDRSPLDAAPIPTIVLRDRLIVYANDAALALYGIARERILGRLYSDFVAPDELERVADRQARRLRGDPAPSVYATTLMSGGVRLAVQVHAIVTGGDVVVQFLDVTGEAARRTRLDGLARLGALVQRELRAEDVRRAVREAFPSLELEGLLLRPEGGDLRVQEALLEEGRAARFEAAFGVPLVGSRYPWTPATRQAWQEGAAFVDDCFAELRRISPGEPPAADAAAAAQRSAAVVRVDLRGRPAALLTAVGEWLRPDDLPAFRLFGSQVSAALDAARSIRALSTRNAKLRAVNRELGLLFEVGRSLVATLEPEQVLEAGVRNLARIVDAPEAFLLLADAGRMHLVVRAAAGSHPELVGRTLSLASERSVASAVFLTRAPLVIEDAQGDPRVDTALQAASGGRAYLGLPLVVRDRAIGAAVIAETRGPRQFTPGQVERAAAIANQLAVAVENARLYADLRRSYAELARAQDQLVRQERLAALGELAAVVAHEVRNPLGAIFNSLGTLRRMVQPKGDARLLFDIVGEEADRLNRIVGDLLAFAKPSPPAALRAEPLDRVLDEAVSAALAEAGGRIALARDVQEGLPLVPMDARLMRQAILNVAANAVQAMPEGGTLSVRARLGGGAVTIELADTGGGIPEEIRARIFEPFFTTKATGTGLGLAVVKRILDDHRGQVEVRAAPAGGTVFVLRLPLAPG